MACVFVFGKKEGLVILSYSHNLSSRMNFELLV